MSKTNKHGLSRDIPSKIKRAVRQNSRFGCIICRSAIYTYEHINPPFVDAKTHDPSQIALLCPTCHALVTKGRIPKDYVSEKYLLIQNSCSVTPPSDQEFFTHYGKSLTINLGPSEFKEFRSIININGVDVLSYHKSQETNQYSVSGVFYDHSGKELFRITDNEWIGPIDAWDVEQVGCRLTIKSSPDKTVFEAVKNNEYSRLTILKLDMYFPPFHIIINPDEFLVGQYAKNTNKSVYFQIDGNFHHGDCALYLDSKRVSQLKPPGITMAGGRGVYIEGSGIWVGFGSSQILIKRIKFYNNDCETGETKQITKSITPTTDQNYFIVGSLEIILKTHPLWNEKEYYINGQRLTSEPYSWGKIGDSNGRTIELFHISRGEPEDLATNPGFVGFYADDILDKEWSDRVFEAEIEESGDNGKYITRVKISDAGSKKIISTVNPATGKPFHPQEFAGTSPWKK